MRILHYLSRAATVAALSCLSLPASTAMASGLPSKNTSKELHQVTATVANMLRLNGSVNYTNPESVTAALAYETGSAKATQQTINQAVIKNKGIAHVTKLVINKHPIWVGKSQYLIHAKMTFQERLIAKNLELSHIVWDNDFLVRMQSNGSWKVTNVLGHSGKPTKAANGQFDYAPNVMVRGLSKRFVTSLNQYIKTAKSHYHRGQVQIDPFGYYYNSSSKSIRLYLFIHNGTRTPIYNVTGSAKALLGSTLLYMAPLALPPSSFGILMPGDTRFCVVHVPSADILNRKIVQSYPRHATVHVRFVFRHM